MKKFNEYDAFPNAPGLSKALGLTKSDEVPIEIIGYGPWKKRWYSICSQHRHIAKNCDICLCGSYKNVWKVMISGMIFKLYPKLWIWWVNRPSGRWAKSFRKKDGK